MWLIGTYLAVLCVLLLLALSAPYPLLPLAVPVFPLAMAAAAALVGISAGRTGPCWFLVGCQIALTVAVLVFIAHFPNTRQGWNAAGYIIVAVNAISALLIGLQLRRPWTPSTGHSARQLDDGSHPPQRLTRDASHQRSGASRRTVTFLLALTLVTGAALFVFGAGFDIYAHYAKNPAVHIDAAVGTVVGVPIMIIGGSAVLAAAVTIWLRRR